jgi:hypothetical protein
MKKQANNSNGKTSKTSKASGTPAGFSVLGAGRKKAAKAGMIIVHVTHILPLNPPPRLVRTTAFVVPAVKGTSYTTVKRSKKKAA